MDDQLDRSYTSRISGGKDMRPTIYYKPSGETFIHPTVYADWMVKSPTKAHRLNGTGTCSLTLEDLHYNLKAKKGGILYIDQTKRGYVYLPHEILNKYPPEGKPYLGMKNSIFVFNVKQILIYEKLELTPIPKHDDDFKAPHELGMAGDIRRKFGL